MKAHLYVRRFQKINIIFCRYHKYKTSILSILWKGEGGRKGNTEHDLNVISGMQLSNHFKAPNLIKFKIKKIMEFIFFNLFQNTIYKKDIVNMSTMLSHGGRQ